VDAVQLGATVVDTPASVALSWSLLGHFLDPTAVVAAICAATHLRWVFTCALGFAGGFPGVLEAVEPWESSTSEAKRAYKVPTHANT
jgi:hypothetical protein